MTTEGVGETESLADALSAFGASGNAMRATSAQLVAGMRKCAECPMPALSKASSASR